MILFRFGRISGFAIPYSTISECLYFGESIAIKKPFQLNLGKNMLKFIAFTKVNLPYGWLANMSDHEI
jgi:hypothetical protein